MRGRCLAFGFLVLTLVCVAGAPTPTKAHFVAWTRGSPVYSGDYPRTLCYKLVGDIAKDQLWISWIDNAAALWNKANTGWTFKKCETDDEKAHPNIVFTFNTSDKKIDGGAAGSGRGGGANIGNWEIRVEPDVTKMSINGTKVGDAGNHGWSMENKNGVQTLDPVLVMEHELGHALGLDHNPGACFEGKTGNVEDPVCAGTHKGPNGRNPSASDVAEVKRGIDAYHKMVEDAKKTAEEGGEKKNQMTPGTNESGQTVYYCDSPPGYYPQVPNCSTPWRAVVTGTNGPPPTGTDGPPPNEMPANSGPGPTMAPGFGLGGFGFGFGGGRGSDDSSGGRDATTRQQQRRP
ncbi:MAG TPA: hypothetical protein VJN67_17720 [Stellaceae bacterium]|nr:hypothetical protein [Stellaceae bacterium]